MAPRIFPPFASTRIARSGFDPATLAWVAAVVANGGTVSLTREGLVDDLITGLRAAGIFSKLDRLWLHAAENQPSALVDIIADVLATAVNSPTFTVDRGYTGDISTMYIDTNSAPSTLTNFTRDSCHVLGWINNDSGGTVIGSDDNTGVQGADRLWGGDAGSPFISVHLDESASNPALTNTPGGSRLGSWIGSRTASNARALYLNGSSIASDAQTTDGGPSTNTFYILAENFGGAGPVSYSAWQVCASGCGGGLTSTEVADFHSLLRTYMTAVGVP